MKQGISIAVILYRPYRAGSRFWHFPCVLCPFRAGVFFALHVRPLKGPLDIRNGVLADSRCFYIFPEKEALVSILSKAVQRREIQHYMMSRKTLNQRWDYEHPHSAISLGYISSEHKEN